MRSSLKNISLLTMRTTQTILSIQTVFICSLCHFPSFVSSFATKYFLDEDHPWNDYPDADSSPNTSSDEGYPKKKKKKKTKRNVVSHAKTKQITRCGGNMTTITNTRIKIAINYEISVLLYINLFLQL